MKSTKNEAWATVIKEDGHGGVIVSCKRKGYYWGVFWCAKITGSDKKYQFARKFETGSNPYSYHLKEGVYDIGRAPRKNAFDNERYYLRVYPTGEYRIIEKPDVCCYVNNIDMNANDDTSVIIDTRPAAKTEPLPADVIPWEVDLNDDPFTVGA